MVFVGKRFLNSEVCEMGILLNPHNIDFWQALNSEIYIDKSMLIE